MTEVRDMLIIPTQVPGCAHGRAVVRSIAQVVAALLTELTRAAGLCGLDRHAVAHRQ